MKKILIGLMGLMGLMGVASCDKIDAGEDGRFVEYAGATANWEEATPIANPVQRALVEKYTGPKCSNCPNADEILSNAQASIGEQLALIAINPSVADGEPYDGQPDMRTADGDAWATEFGGGTSMALPFAMLNRDASYQGTGQIAGISTNVQTAIAGSPKVALEVTAAADGNVVGIDVTVNFLQSISDELTLTLALTEDSLRYYQLWAGHTPPLVSDYAHNHMLRDVITDVWGVDVKADGVAGEARKAHFSYTLPAGVVKENCHIVAFVSDKASRKVINCAESHIQ